MGVEIRPEPTSEEREAILRALEEIERGEDGSAWWRSGLLDGIEDDEEL